MGVGKATLKGMEWVDQTYTIEMKKFQKAEVVVKVAMKKVEVVKSIGFSMNEDF